MIVIRNTDSFRFCVRRFLNVTTGRHWWLINLILYTIITNNRGEIK